MDLLEKEIVIDEFKTIKAKKIIIATGTTPNTRKIRSVIALFNSDLTLNPSPEREGLAKCNVSKSLNLMTLTLNSLTDVK